MRADLIGFNNKPNGLGQLVEELVAGILGAALQLEHDVFFVSVNSGVKVATGVNLIHQLTDHGSAGFSFIAAVCCQNSSAVIVEGIQGHYIAQLVVVDFNFRIDAQQHGSYAVVGGSLNNIGSAASAVWHCSCPGFISAGGQRGQGQSGGQGKPNQFGSEVLFHLGHLKMLLCLSSAYRIRSR